MGILAQDERLLWIVVKILLAPRWIGIHRADDIGVVRSVVYGTLIVYRSRWVVCLNPGIYLLKVRSHTRLVTHTPADD